MILETHLSGSTAPIQVSTAQYTLQAPGLRGRIRELSKDEQTTRGGEASDRNQQQWLDSLQTGEVVLLKQFEIEVSADEHAGAPDATTRAGGLKMRTAQNEPAMVFTAPKTRENLQTVLFYTDESGESRWILPEAQGADKQFTFLLPREGGEVPRAEEGKVRGQITKGIRRVVKVIGWLTDELVSMGALPLIRKWEEKNRPYGFHYVEPGKIGANPIPWERIGAGRSLLLIHGTFSSGKAAYEGLINSPWMEKLTERYEGRIFAFDHPSLHQTPADNIRTLAQMLPPDLKNLELDIITHSRGGLVGRELCERFAEHNSTGKIIDVKKALFVAGPNNGTILANKDNWVKLIDAYTNLLTELPDNPFTITLEALITLVKVVAGGTVKALPGLQSMLPGGDYLQALNDTPPPSTTYYALAARYMPNDEKLLVRFGKRLVMKALAGIFGEDSDMVVPTRGCYEIDPGKVPFQVADKRRIVYDLDADVNHINFFNIEMVNRQLYDWLK